MLDHSRGLSFVNDDSPSRVLVSFPKRAITIPRTQDLPVGESASTPIMDSIDWFKYNTTHHTLIPGYNSNLVGNKGAVGCKHNVLHVGIPYPRSDGSFIGILIKAALGFVGMLVYR